MNHRGTEAQRQRLRVLWLALLWVGVLTLGARSLAQGQEGVGLLTNDCTGRWLIRWTNAPACLVVEGSADLSGWFPLFHVSRWDASRWKVFDYEIGGDGAGFYRLRASGCWSE